MRPERLVLLRGRGEGRDLPTGRLRHLRRHALLALRRRRHRGRLRHCPDWARGGPSLPHRDLHRAARRPAPDPAGGAREAPRRPRRRPQGRGRPRHRRRRQPRSPGRGAPARGDREGADRRPAHRGGGGEDAAGLHSQQGPVDRRGEHGLRGRRHPPPAGRCLRDGGQDAAHLPPDRRALRPDDPGPPAGALVALPAGRPHPA